MSKQNQNDALRKALDKAKTSNRRKNLSEEERKVRRERNKIDVQQYQARLLLEERKIRRERNKIHK